MDDFVANAALLAAHLSQQCERSASVQQEAARDLRDCVDGIARSVTFHKAELEQFTRSAIMDALAQELPAVSRSFAEAASRLDQMGARLQESQSSAQLRMRILGWKSLVSLGLAAVSLAGGTAYVAWHNIKRAERAHVRAEVLEALSQVAITSCAGRPCVKLEDGLQRWASNDEYIFVDTRAPEEAPSR